jgi:hypothetical protein
MGLPSKAAWPMLRVGSVARATADVLPRLRVQPGAGLCTSTVTISLHIKAFERRVVHRDRERPPSFHVVVGRGLDELDSSREP